MPFIAAIIAFFGNSTTVMLNAGDYSREMKGGYSTLKRGSSLLLIYGTGYSTSWSNRCYGIYSNWKSKPDQCFC